LNTRRGDADMCHCYRASTVLAVIVCLSVCHKSELYKDGYTHGITLTTPCNSLRTLVFWCQKSPWNSNQITSTGRQIKVG